MMFTKADGQSLERIQQQLKIFARLDDADEQHEGALQLVMPAGGPSDASGRYPLRGTPYRYDDPTSPVADEE